MIDKLKSILTRYDELEELMSQPDAMHDIKTFTKMAREHTSISELVDHAKTYINTYYLPIFILILIIFILILTIIYTNTHYIYINTNYCCQ